MIRKITCGLLVAAAFLTGCQGSKKIENVQDEVIPVTTEIIEEEPIPTDRPREIEETDDFEYEILDGSAVITKYTGNGGAVVVPDTIEGVPVTSIGYYAFEAKYSVRTVKLPETVTLIGEGAFMDCGGLTEINIPDAVEGIERGAFVSCTSLEYIEIPENTRYIHEEAFTACEAMTELVIYNPDLAYENWGLEELPELVIVAPEGSAVLKWAEEKGLTAEAL